MKHKQAFHFKSGNFTLSVINVNTNDFNQIKALLESKVSKVESFFRGIPFIIDVSSICSKVSVDFIKKINRIFESSKMIPIGYVIANKELKMKVIKAGLNVFSNNTNYSSNKELEEKVNCYKTRFINTPVRSGQQIIAKNENVIVTSHINHGSEIIADGSIIVYGNVGGKLIAGSSGDESATIICRSLQAELISIAGQYVTPAENQQFFSDAMCDNGCLISLDKEGLSISYIS